jgi:hypothetical protein
MNMDTAQLVALAAALGWASGLRLYLVLFVVGMLAHFNVVPIPQGLQMLGHTWVLAASGFMVVIEFFADKIPWIDSTWDAIHTFIRIPAGAALAAGVMGEGDPATTLALGILGGTLAASSHFTKAGSRALINTSPEPFTNWIASFSEEAIVGAGLYLAFTHPFIAAGMVVVIILISIWLIPKIWRAIVGLVNRIATWFAPHGERR